MTYRQAFDHLGQPRSPALRHRAALTRWLGVVAFIMIWAFLTGWLDGVA